MGLRVSTRTSPPDVVASAIQGGWFESREAHSVDALVELLGPDSSMAAGPETMLHVVVDYDALMRGVEPYLGDSPICR